MTNETNNSMEQIKLNNETNENETNNEMKQITT